ncbi:MAG: hypothetical protein JSW17_05535 [Candidatus Omnitrophota bacterium]|nr:MAG: hypothetical protein JSW17_05535 [Candidatus Omnitrophota bacterium]
MEILSESIPVIIIVVIFFFVVRIATVILKLTGLDDRTARFQAISAFTGTGFTTKEAEMMVLDDLRRRTLVVLMILGKIGIVSIIAGVFLSFGKTTLTEDLKTAAIILAFLFILYRITTLKGFSRTLNRFIEKRIIAHGIVKQKVLEELFHLPEGYGIAQLTITAESKEKGLTLAEAGFIHKDILVLSIERGKGLIPFPHASDTLEEGDKLLCYGFLKNIKSYVELTKKEN